MSLTSVSVSTIDNADCTTARKAAEAADGVGEQWVTTAEEARRQARWVEAEQWLGPAAEAAAHRMDASVNHWDIAGVSVQAVGLIAGVHVKVLWLAQRVVRAALKAARLAAMHVEEDGTVTGGWATTVPGVGSGLAAALSSTLRSALSMVTSSDSLSAQAVRTVGSAGQEAVDLSDFSADQTGDRTDSETASGEPAGGGTVGSPPVRRVDSPGGPVFIAGDVRSAEVVTTFVSGVGSSAEGSTVLTREWARQEVAQAQADGKNIAVIAWHGYRAPANLATAISSTPAHAGAADLRKFQQELRAQNPRATLNVVGFSYGSVVAGTAARPQATEQGLEADSLTFLGSPGVGVDNAEDLRLLRQGVEHPGEVRSEHVPGDLIQLTTEPGTGVHGRDPSSPGFGARDDTWSAYHWQRLLDYYIIARGDHDTHSSYLWDPSIELTR